MADLIRRKGGAPILTLVDLAAVRSDRQPDLPGQDRDEAPDGLHREPA